jgi:hypothetical protein
VLVGADSEPENSGEEVLSVKSGMVSGRDRDVKNLLCASGLADARSLRHELHPGARVEAYEKDDRPTPRVVALATRTLDLASTG